MKIICSVCGRDINVLGQDNMSYTMEPLCEDCYYHGMKHDKAPRDKDGVLIANGDYLTDGKYYFKAYLKYKTGNNYIVFDLAHNKEFNPSELWHYWPPTFKTLLRELKNMKNIKDYDEVIKKCSTISDLLSEKLELEGLL